MVGRVTNSDPFLASRLGSNGSTGPLDCPRSTIIPRRARQSSPFMNVVRPTESYTTCTPAPPVIRFTSAWKSVWV